MKKKVNNKYVCAITIYGFNGKELVNIVTYEEALRYKKVNPLVEISKFKVMVNHKEFVKLFNYVYGYKAINNCWYESGIKNTLKDMVIGYNLYNEANILIINTLEDINNKINLNSQRIRLTETIKTNHIKYDIQLDKMYQEKITFIKEDVLNAVTAIKPK